MGTLRDVDGKIMGNIWEQDRKKYGKTIGEYGISHVILRSFCMMDRGLIMISMEFLVGLSNKTQLVIYLRLQALARWGGAW